ncbi:SEC8 [Auxenochlorella protothecoides x Auxenochlorella symbiontica]
MVGRGDVIRRAAVDWDAVDAELQGIPSSFKEPRFDSVKHVLSLLSDERAEQELARLRAQSAAVDALVTDVVDTYYAGFNRAIQNYSHILKLFSDARVQLSTLRQTLGTSLQQFDIRLAHVHSLWQRHMLAAETLRLLGDVEAVLAVPSRLADLQQSKSWSAAVSTLVDACDRLARAELAGVGALHPARQGMAAARASLVGALVAELEAHLAAAADAAAAAEAAASVSLGAGAAAAPGTPWAAPAGAAPRLRSQAIATPLRSQAATPLRPAASSLALGSSLSARGLASGTWAAAATGSGTPVRPTHRRTRTYASPGGLDRGHLHGGPAADAAAQLTRCLGRLGAAGEARAALRAGLAHAMHGAVARAVRLVLAPEGEAPGGHGEGVAWARPGAVPAVKEGDAAPASQAPPAAERGSEALALLRRASAGGLAALGATTRALGALADAAPPPASPGLAVLLGPGDGTEGAGARMGMAGDAGAGAVDDVAAAWTCLQRAMRTALAAVLSTAAPGSPGRGPSRALLGAGGAGPGLRLSLRHELGRASSGPGSELGSGLGAGSTPAPPRPPADAEAVGAAVRAVLQRCPGGPDPTLVVALYPVVAAFLASGERTLAGAAAAGAGSLARDPGAGAGPSTPPRTGAPRRGSPSPLRPAAAEDLRGWLDSHLRHDFLPAAYLELRGRVGEAVAGPAAFRQRGGEVGLPALAAARAALDDALAWAEALPPCATDLLGMAENMLGQVLEAGQGEVESAAGELGAGALGASAAWAAAMASEPAAALLPSPAFFGGAGAAGAGAGAEAAAASLLAARWGAGGGDATRDLARRLLDAAPPGPGAVAEEALRALCALCGGLDRLARGLADEGGLGGEHAGGLQYVVERFRAVIGRGLRTLRLEAMLSTLRTLQQGGGPAELEHQAAALSGTLRTFAEVCERYLDPPLAAYVLEGVSGAAVVALRAVTLAAWTQAGGLLSPGAASDLELGIAAVEAALVGAPGGSGGRHGQALRAAASLRPVHELLRLLRGVEGAEDLLEAAGREPSLLERDQWLDLLLSMRGGEDADLAEQLDDRLAARPAGIRPEAPGGEAAVRAALHTAACADRSQTGEEHL